MLGIVICLVLVGWFLCYKIVPPHTSTANTLTANAGMVANSISRNNNGGGTTSGGDESDDSGDVSSPCSAGSDSGTTVPDQRDESQSSMTQQGGSVEDNKGDKEQSNSPGSSGSGSSDTPCDMSSGTGGSVTTLVVVSPVALDGTSNLDFTIDGGVSVVHSPALTLGFNADPQKVTGYAVSLNPTFEGAVIQPYSNPPTNGTFQLPNTFGTYTLYVEYFSSTGNRSPILAHVVSYQPAVSKPVVVPKQVPPHTSQSHAQDIPAPDTASPLYTFPSNTNQSSGIDTGASILYSTFMLYSGLL